MPADARRRTLSRDDIASWVTGNLRRPAAVALGVNVDSYLRRQAGVISHQQALAAGMSRSAVQRRVSAGQWRQLHPGVYLATDRERTDEVRLRAAVLWAGTGAAAHGIAAAWWHELWPRLPSPLEVTVPRTRAPRRRPGVALRYRTIDAQDLTEYRDMPITSVALTAIEAAVALGPKGSMLLDRALQRYVTFGWVYRTHCRNLGRHGSAAASAMLVAAADRAASHAERLLVELLRVAGISGWKLNHAWEGYLIDLAFPVQRVAIEVDGWAWHTTPERFVHDRQRQNALANGGWHVLRFTWHDLTGRADAVIRDIRTALESQ